MQRNAYQTLTTWKNLKARKPLMVEGAPRVGKTALISSFGAQEFDAVAYIDLSACEDARRAFEEERDPSKLLALIGALTGTDPADACTLVFLDEVQACPHAIAALGSIYDKLPQVPVIAAGTGLRTAIYRCQKSGDAPSSWSNGKVLHLGLHPLAFDEFVAAVGNEQLARTLREGDFDQIDSLADSYTELLRTYLYVGGMPEAVEAYRAAALSTDNATAPDTAPSGEIDAEPASAPPVPSDDALAAAREVQTTILAGFEAVFSSQAATSSQAERARQLWTSIPKQLMREGANKRFVFSAAAPGARGRDYREALAWLEDLNLVTRVCKVRSPEAPLSKQEDPHYFKLYLLDTGLLGAAAGLDAELVHERDRIFTEGGGAFTEQYVCQQLVASNLCTSRYWAADGKRQKGKVDFVYEYDGEVYPVEVRPGGGKPGKAVRELACSYGLEGALMLSLSPAEDEGNVLNLPLYAACLLP